MIKNEIEQEVIEDNQTEQPRKIKVKQEDLNNKNQSLWKFYGTVI
ncbi:hypothetical protein [Spiroplasma endosymbiont of Polydrusus formosus]